MFGLAIKLYTMLMPFLKEVLLGNKRIKKHERNINYFLIFACTIMFIMLFISNLTNSKLITKINELNVDNAALKENIRVLSTTSTVATEEYNKINISLMECQAVNNNLYNVIDDLESIECSDKPQSLANRFRNIENGVCELDKINLKANMPPLPKISRTIDNNNNSDSYTGDVLIKYVSDLREYIREEDIKIEKQKDNCK